MHKITSENHQSSPSRKRVRPSVIQNENINSCQVTPTMGKDCKRPRLEMQPKSNENFTIESEDAKSSNIQERSSSLTSLNDDVLLHIFRYLNWMDSINIAASCERFVQLKYLWVEKRDQEFRLDEYMEMEDNLPKTMLPAIAPYITVLETSTHNRRIMKLCRNIKSLSINYKIGRSAARKINSWIKESNVTSFSFNVCDDIDALLDGVTVLQKLEINYFHRNTEQIIERNTNLERLSIKLDTNYNFHAFRTLQDLQSLHIRSSDIVQLGGIQKYGNLENLTEFSFQCDFFSDEHILYSFIEHLAEKSKLDKLQLVDYFILDHIFDAMTSLNLSALSLCCGFSVQGLLDFILANPSPRLKHLKLSTCSSELLLIVIEKWTSLEAICLYVDSDDLHEILDESFIKKILETSITRPLLKLHLVARRESELLFNIEIFINFVEQQLKAIKQRDEFCCPTTKSFSFSSRECFLHEL